ncbi:hypothetical protein [Actinocrinis sp.]|uniref:hypothetical protein n=1 Tax=Actinocrinis sp. TaxID=1920516 RepID=UPI002D687147|nr:hypothetical protein [Actinocrinis sp.]HZP55039.1 hypothetical protein [Actinocrinis sp.]
MITPYVSAASFRAHPTYLDLDDLRYNDPSSLDQTAQLNDLLLMSSAWADGYCEQPLAAHQNVQNLRTRFTRDGTLKVHPDHTPVITVTSVGYGYTPTSLTTFTNPAVWSEDGRNLVVTIGSGGPWTGSLQFGVPGAGAQVYTQLVYTAGFVATVLSAGASAGAMSLSVTDPTGIEPGGVYRIWEPGAEESVTVSSAFTPPAFSVPPVPTAVPLAAPTLFAHTAAQDFTNMEHDMRLGIVNYTVAQLLRPDTAAEDAYPDSRMASGTRQTDSRKDGSGLIDEAERLLERFRRVR